MSASAGACSSLLVLFKVERNWVPVYCLQYIWQNYYFIACRQSMETILYFLLFYEHEQVIQVVIKLLC